MLCDLGNNMGDVAKTIILQLGSQLHLKFRSIATMRTSIRSYFTESTNSKLDLLLNEPDYELLSSRVGFDTPYDDGNTDT